MSTFTPQLLYYSILQNIQLFIINRTEPFIKTLEKPRSQFLSKLFVPELIKQIIKYTLLVICKSTGRKYRIIYIFIMANLQKKVLCLLF